MSGLTKVILIGNLGRNPETQFTLEGKAVLHVWGESVCDGKLDAAWLQVVCRQGLAETVNKHLAKGRQVYVEGRLRPKQWEGKDGKLYTSLDVMGDKVLFLGAEPEAVEVVSEQELETKPDIDMSV